MAGRADDSPEHLQEAAIDGVLVPILTERFPRLRADVGKAEWNG